ncbi:MAG: hypothetical protein AAF517_25500, partial [Planctomycetota bacterium]
FLADAGISIPASIRADIFFGVASIAVSLEPQANLSFTPWLEAHANARVTPNVEFDPVTDIHMYLDARFKLFAKVKACIFWELECIEIPDSDTPIINQPIFTCEDIVDAVGTSIFDCECPGCIETCDDPGSRDCADANSPVAQVQGPVGIDIISVHEEITIPSTSYSPNGRRTLDVWMAADQATEGTLNVREFTVGEGARDFVFTLNAPNPYFLDPATAYISDDVALIAFTETNGTTHEDVPELDGSNTAEHVAVANRNAARANIRIHALTPDIRPRGPILGVRDLIDSGVDVSETSADLNAWRVDGSSSMVATPGTQSAWVAWVRYEEDFLEDRGLIETAVPCDGVRCPPGTFEKRTVPNIQPRITSAAIYVQQVTHNDVDGVIPVPGFTPGSISLGGINIEPEIAALPEGDLVTCLWVHDGEHENLVEDNRGRNLQFASWDSTSGEWSAPVEVIDPLLLDGMPGVLEPRIVVRRKEGVVDGLLAFTALPEGSDINDTGLGGLRYLYLVRFRQLDDGSFEFDDPVRLRGRCNARVYTWDYVLTQVIDATLVDPAEEIAKHGPDWVVVFNERGIPGTLASSGDVNISVLGLGQDEWTAPVCVSDGTRVISNLSATITPEGSVRAMFRDGGAARVPAGAFAGIAGGVDVRPRGVQSLDVPLRHDLAIASCVLSQQFPGPGAQVKGTVRVENRGFTGSGMDPKTEES